jgi:hypothetical protein
MNNSAVSSKSTLNQQWQEFWFYFSVKNQNSCHCWLKVDFEEAAELFMICPFDAIFED